MAEYNIGDRVRIYWNNERVGREKIFWESLTNKHIKIDNGIIGKIVEIDRLNLNLKIYFPSYGTFCIKKESGLHFFRQCTKQTRKIENSCKDCPIKFECFTE